MGNACPDGSAAGNGCAIVQPSPSASSFACATAAPSSAENIPPVPMIGTNASRTSASTAAWAASGASTARLASVAQLAPQFVDLVAQAGGVLEAQLGSSVVHLVLQRLDETPQLGRRQVAELVAAPFVALALHAATTVASGRRRLAVTLGPEVGEDVGDGLADRLRIDAVLGVVRLLQPAAAVRLGQRTLHRVGDVVGVHDHLAVDVAGCSSDHLDQRRLAAEEPFLVRVEDGDQRDLGEVETLAQQVDADEDVEL